MPTIEEIQKQIQAIPGGTDLWGTKKEVRHLPEVLQQGEAIRHLTSGMMEGNTWLIVCTNRRVLLLDKGLLYGLKQKEIQLKSISSVEHSTGMFFGEIVITVSSNRLKIENCVKQTVKAFVGALNAAREEVDRPAPAAIAAAAPADDFVSKLERLAALRERGMLSDEEFAQQKQRLLSA